MSTRKSTTGKSVGSRQKQIQDIVDGKGRGVKQVNVGNPLLAARWLALELGTGPLSGMMMRDESVVFCPRIGEDGYQEPEKSNDDEEQDHDGPAQVCVVDKNRLAARTSFEYDCGYEREGKGNESIWIPSLFPVESARTVLDAIDKAPNVRTLRGVTHTPIPRADGSLITEPGYDKRTGLLYLPTVDVPTVPRRPSKRQLETAVELLRGLVAEFKWVGKHDEANFIGLMLTPLLRLLAPPPWKMGAIMARQPGSGKSLLARVLRIVHDGVFRSNISGENEELRKQISSILHRTTAPVVQFDNVTGTLRSATLAGLLTSGVYSDRVLGATEELNMTNDRLWCLTGNNLSFGGDLVRRTLWVTVDPKVKNPEKRTGFKLNLPSYVAEHRGEILRALLTLVVAWVNKGSPMAHRSSDDYAQWSATVRGILKNAGFPGEFDHSDSAQQKVGEDDDEWREFLEAVHRHFGNKRWTVRDLLGSVTGEHAGRVDLEGKSPGIPDDALPTELAEKMARSHSVSKSMGKWLAYRDGRFAGDYVCRKAGEKGGVQRWQVEKG